MTARWAGFPLAWWVALSVLALNDHVLKGSGLLPGVVTGKLSDFAGLIVAPILGCTALGLRSERGRLALFGVVALAGVDLPARRPDAAALSLRAPVLRMPVRGPAGGMRELSARFRAAEWVLTAQNRRVEAAKRGGGLQRSKAAV